MEYLDYLDKNDTAYLEFHQWRNEAIPRDEFEDNMTHTGEMMCNMCKVVRHRKDLGFPKRKIKSVASWWWLNVHDELCTKDYTIPSWITQFPPVTMANSYDQLGPKMSPK